MSFFDDLPPRPPKPEPRKVTRPAWARPHSGVVPAISTQQAVLLRSDRLAVIVDGFRVYPNGVEFRVSVENRPGQTDEEDPFDPFFNNGTEADLLQYGVQFADGTKWSCFDERPSRDDDDVVGPIVVPTASFSQGSSHHMQLWLWPLPPPGLITLVAIWPAHQLDEQAITIDANELRALSNNSQVLWPDWQR